jgi:hypothetical protein
MAMGLLSQDGQPLPVTDGATSRRSGYKASALKNSEHRHYKPDRTHSIVRSGNSPYRTGHTAGASGSLNKSHLSVAPVTWLAPHIADMALV